MEFVVLLIYRFFTVYYWMIFAYIILSWIPQIRYSGFYALLARVVEPYLSVFRRLIPPIGGIDFSPILAFFALNLATNGFLNLFYGLL